MVIMRKKEAMSDEERFLAKVRVSETGCWEWLGNRSPNGYGRFWWNGQKGLAHRFAYETFIGAIPEGKELDHKCRNEGCVNPEHLELVTHQENILRGVTGEVNARRIRGKTHCPRGHPYDEVNTYIDPRGNRNCRICGREAWRRWRQREKEKEAQNVQNFHL